MEASLNAGRNLEFGWLIFLSLGERPDWVEKNNLQSPQFIFWGKIICALIKI